MQEVKASFILPVYNGQEFLKDAIESVLCQDGDGFEILILDDGSTDRSWEVISSFDDRRIRSFRRENRGLARTLNELIDLSRGEFIFRMDADDKCYPTRFKEQIRLLERDKALVLVGGQIDFLAGNHVFSSRKFPVEHEKILNDLLSQRFSICHPACAFRKSAALTAGCYLVHDAGEDLDFFLRMSEVGRLGNVDARVLSYRLAHKSLSLRKRTELTVAYAYAIENWKRRACNKPEVSFTDFKSKSLNENFLGNAFKSIDMLAERLYRGHFFFKKERPLRALAMLLIAALLRPRTAVQRARASLFKVNP